MSLRRALVFADDLTGAAELAGAGHRCGIATRVLRRPATRIDDGLTVFDTDSRSLSPAHAAETIRTFFEPLHAESFDLVYKKTDSALRGPVAAECEALAAELECNAVILVPQNPSRRRTIHDAIYRVDDVPLHQTAFAYDPEYPARTSDVREIVAGAAFQQPDGDQPIEGVTIGGGETMDDLRHWARRVDPHLLPAGGVEFFQAIFERRGCAPTRRFLDHLPSGRTLFLCGSASDYRRTLVARARQHGVSVLPMPAGVFARPSASSAEFRAWASELLKILHAQDALVVIEQPVARDRTTPQQLQELLAELADVSLRGGGVMNLMLEGGATAAAVCRRMKWDELEVTGEFASGVVQMCAGTGMTPSTNIVVKPGSYAWPEAIWLGKK